MLFSATPRISFEHITINWYVFQDLTFKELLENVY